MRTRREISGSESDSDSVGDFFPSILSFQLVAHDLSTNRKDKAIDARAMYRM